MDSAKSTSNKASGGRTVRPACVLLASCVWLASGVALSEEKNAPRIVLGETGHVGEVTSVAFSPDSKWLAAGCREQVVRLWEMPVPAQADK